MSRRAHDKAWYRASFFSLALLAATLVASSGWAQSASNAAAQALFDQGKALMGAGKQAEACPKFEESQRLDPSSGTLINLALCYEETGRIASAWSAYRDAAALAALAGNKDREGGARERAAALEPSVSKLTIDVPDAARLPGLVVTRDGVEVGAAQWGVPIPTDEGAHEIVAKAPGYQDWQSKVDVRGPGTAASVSVPTLPRVPEAVTPVAAATPALSGPPAEEKSSGLGGQRIGALVAAGVGVAGLAVGTIFGLQASSKKDEADKSCDGSSCTTAAGVTAGKDAHAAGNISTISMIVGAVGLAGGAALWFTAPSRESATEVGLGFGSIELRTKF